MVKLALMTFTPQIRRMGITAGLSFVLLEVAYAGVLVAGLQALSSPDQPIPDPYFTAMEVLILLMVPALIFLMTALHGWAAPARKGWSLAALIFTSLLCGLTAAVHFTILTLSWHPDYAGQTELAFTWPSLVYALDILAWDVFFTLAALSAAMVFGGKGLEGVVRALLVLSGLLASAGLAGVVTGDMQIRNIGILGYVGVFPLAVLGMTALFRRTPPV